MEMVMEMEMEMEATKWIPSLNSQLSRLSSIGNRIVILNIERPLADSSNNNNGNNYNNDKSKTKVGGGTGRQQLSHNSAINSYRVWTSC